MPKLGGRKILKQDDAEIQRGARQNRSSLKAEILKLRADKAEMARRHASAAKAMKELDKLRLETSRKYPNQPDSADLIREDRDTR